MKRSISILLCIVLIFSSFTFASAADWSTTDSNNLATIKNSVISGGQLYNVVNACNTALNNINYNLVTLMGWLDPATGGSTTALLNQILNALVYTNVGGATVSFLNDLRTENLIQSNMLSNLYNYGFVQDVSPVTVSYGKDSTSIGVGVITLPWNQAILYSFNELRGSLGRNYVWTNDKMYENAESFQSYVNWSTLNSSTFTPASGIDGIYKYLSYIQNPVARLSYVLASDERIEAQELAAANEQAVVDEFIDSSGDGSVPTSSFSDVSGLSSGVTSNLSTDASPAQIWDIFNSDHGSWFSQETANQLDTTTRTRGSEFETPLLDQQMEEIYKSLGGGK